VLNFIKSDLFKVGAATSAPLSTAQIYEMKYNKDGTVQGATTKPDDPIEAPPVGVATMVYGSDGDFYQQINSQSNDVGYGSHVSPHLANDQEASDESMSGVFSIQNAISEQLDEERQVYGSCGNYYLSDAPHAVFSRYEKRKRRNRARNKVFIDDCC